MLLDFLSLPQNTQNSICILLNNHCVLRMREVCKSTKDIIRIWANTQKSIVRHLQIVEEVFHHIGKKAHFQASRREQSYNVQIGKVKVENGPVGLRISSM
ncbi:hypothetical protein PRIPAC_73834 [Pristionchus pacificus]|uniref:Uncharacterized protein n=1 Tax=Pristionchus pacificus TaxID=54126 RepID=A0A2A6BZN9_PRIPA|nr:hypothetical protein PRIPAC_73834 [Pristionchus pacificus]|eukprot:PDM71319.1 hypothetical protein PRIPAC_37726 [Pristionchus pacificus]